VYKKLHAANYSAFEGSRRRILDEKYRIHPWVAIAVGLRKE
jgi:hypothetical protein